MKRVLMVGFVALSFAFAQDYADSLNAANALKGALNEYIQNASFEVGYVPGVGVILYGTFARTFGEADPQEIISAVQHVISSTQGLFADLDEEIVLYIRAIAGPWTDTGRGGTRHLAMRFSRPDSFHVWIDGVEQ